MGRDVRIYVARALGYALVLEGMLVAAILFWPDFRDNIPAVLKMVPGRILGDLVQSVVRQGATAYVLLQHIFKGCHGLGGAAAVLFAMGAIAGEAHRGTLEIWLARPISRKRLLLERYVLGALALAVPIFATSATIPWLLSIVKEEPRAVPWMLVSTHEAIFLLAIYSLTFLLSALGRQPSAIAFGMLLLVVLEFALYLVMEVTHWSIVRLADIEDFLSIVERGTLDWRTCGPLLAFSALCLAGSLVAFERRTP